MHSTATPSGFRADDREGRELPVNNSLMAVDRSGEWGLLYKKINDSTTSQFTVGPPYARYHGTPKFLSFPPRPSPQATPPRRIANFSKCKRRDTEEVGPAYLNSTRPSCRTPGKEKPLRKNLTLVADSGVPVLTVACAALH